MTAPASEPSGGSPAEPSPSSEEKERGVLSYQGSKVPLFVVAIWLAFFVWGVYYLLRWIPESWREWFAR